MPEQPSDEISADPAELLQRARTAYEAGDLKQAEGICRSIVLEYPEDPVANRILGNLAGHAGDLRSAEEFFRKVISADPHAYDAAEWVANIHRATGRIGSAINICQGLIKMRPELPGPYSCIGLCYLDRGTPEEALPFLDKAVHIAPESPTFHYNLALAYSRVGNSEEAKSEYKSAVSLAPDIAGFQRSLGKFLHEQRDYKEAASCLQKLVELEPTANNYALLAASLDGAGLGAQAEDALKRALALEPGSIAAHEALGTHEMEKGKFSEAEKSFRKSIESDPSRARGYYEVTRTRKMTESDRPMILKLEELAKESNRPPEDLRLLHYGLGKSYEDLGDFKSAMASYDKANEFARKLQLGSKPFSLSVMANYVDDLISTFTPDFFVANAALGADSELPIFIIGMIRSGTTLMDQILSSHPKIGSAGEMAFWSSGPAVQKVVAITREQVDREELKELALSYLEELQAFAPDAPRITDKMPLNYLSLGLIHLLLPNARIIRCKRNPIDTCLSIYTTPFAATMEFFYDKQNIVDAYREYERLSAHWREVLPSSRFLEVNYEDLVLRRESVLPALIDFCGLDWDDRLLRHEENVRPIKTPSQWQARQPIYSSSVERWRRYEPWLGEFQQLAD